MTVYDGSGHKAIDHERDKNEQEQFQEHLETVGKFNDDIVKKFKQLESQDCLASHKEFIAEMEQEIKAINSLDGPLYTEQGKKAAIRDVINSLKKKHRDLAESEAAEANHNRASLREEVKSEIVKQDNGNLSPEDVNRLLFKTTEFQAEVQSRLLGTGDPFTVIKYFEQLLDRSKYDADLARFLSKHNYLFIQRINETSQSTEKHNLTQRISAGAQKARALTSSPMRNALIALEEKLTGQIYSAPRVMIDNSANAYIRKYAK